MLFILASANLSAMPITFSGELDHKNDYDIISFHVDTASNVNIWTDSQGAGSFDPILSLFDESGTYLMENDDNGFGPNTQVNFGQGIFDSTIASFLDIGNYFLAISIWPNFADSTQPLETAFNQTVGTPLPEGSKFYNVYLEGEHLNVAQVMEPGTLGLFFIGALGLLRYSRVRSKS